MKELWIALVMVEGLEGIQGGKQDLRFAEAESESEAVKLITAHDPHMPRVQKKTVIRIVMLDTVDNYKARKMSPAGEPEVPVRARRRRRR